MEMLGKVLRRKVLVHAPSDKEGVSKIITEVDHRFWTLIVSDDLKTLITVRRAHEDEVQKVQEG